MLLLPVEKLICPDVQVYLWLPVSDMFSTILAKIQVLMLQIDIERMQADPNFSLDSSDGVYILFLCIGIIGYFTIPTVAGWIIQAGGLNVGDIAPDFVIQTMSAKQCHLKKYSKMERQLFCSFPLLRFDSKVTGIHFR